MKPTVAILTGPTASGKSALALELARRFPLEIVGADSLQIFRALDIGTAKPSLEERRLVPHHMIDCLDPDADITAAWYAPVARAAINQILSRGRLPLIVGGSGFYLRALEHPPISTAEEVDDAEEVSHDWLMKHDPETARKIHPNDQYRLRRSAALLRVGKKPSDLWQASSQMEPPFSLLWLAIAHERADLYDRINRRVTQMFAEGLIDEASQVRRDFPAADRRLRRALGYRDALAVVDGEMSVEKAVEKTRQETRQYAKRQLTWFRREERITWLDPNDALAGARRSLPDKMT